MRKIMTALLCALLLSVTSIPLYAQDAAPEFIIPAQYDMAGKFCDGRAFVSIGAKCGFIDETGTLVIPLLYDFATDFKNGRSVASQGGKYGMIDTNGNTVVPFIYDALDTDFSSNEPIYALKDGKYGFIDANGNTVLPFIYDNVNMIGFSEGLCSVQKEGTPYGFIDESGQTAIPFDIRFAGHFKEHVAQVSNGEKWGLMLPDGSVPLGYIFDEIGWSMNEGVIAVCQNEKWALSDGFKLLTDYLYDAFGINMTEGRFPALLNGKWGCLDAEGNVAIPFAFDAIGAFENGTAAAAKDGKYGLIGRDGTEILPFVWENISEGADGIWVAERDGKQGAIDEAGNVVIPCLYHGLLYQNTPLIAAERDGSWGFIYNPASGVPKPTPAAENSALETLRPSPWARAEVLAATQQGLLDTTLLERYEEGITRLDFCHLLGTLTEQLTEVPLSYLLEDRGFSLRQTLFFDTTDETVLALSALGVVTGTAPGQFSPDEIVTRQQAAVFYDRLLNVLGIPISFGEAPLFQDEPSFAPWSAAAISRISSLTHPETGQPVLAGTSETQFSPEDMLTREQAYVSVYRFLETIIHPWQRTSPVAFSTQPNPDFFPSATPPKGGVVFLSTQLRCYTAKIFLSFFQKTLALCQKSGIIRIENVIVYILARKDGDVWQPLLT